MAEKLESMSSVPMYRQLSDNILKDITSGIYPPGTKIPTEFELSSTYNVSRVTVRKALYNLQEKGYLERKPGKGTFVAEQKFQRGLSNNVMGFSEMCRMLGMTSGARTVKIALEEPSADDIRLMKLSENDKILVLERIRYANEKPVAIEISRFPECFSFLFGENLNDVSLFTILRDKYNIYPDHSQKTIDIIFANSRQAKELNITKGYPLLRIENITQDTDEKYLWLSTQLCIGDKFKLIV